MLLHLQNVLNADEIQACYRALTASSWQDGRLTAGSQSAQVKHNLQAAQHAPNIQTASQTIETALARHALLFSAALPRRIYPPLFNRYETGMHFGAHIDNAIRTTPTGERLRTDLSITLFLSEPDSYQGGELIIDDLFGEHSVKLAAGDAILYPAGSVHRVEPVTQGVRVAAFSWIESMVSDAGDRRMLFDLDLAIAALRQATGDSPPLITLTGVYHNLLRKWALV